MKCVLMLMNVPRKYLRSFFIVVLILYLQKPIIDAQYWRVTSSLLLWCILSTVVIFYYLSPCPSKTSLSVDAKCLQHIAMNSKEDPSGEPSSKRVATDPNDVCRVTPTSAAQFDIQILRFADPPALYLLDTDEELSEILEPTKDVRSDIVDIATYKNSYLFKKDPLKPAALI
jgi:hypothetical protein